MKQIIIISTSLLIILSLFSCKKTTNTSASYKPSCIGTMSYSVNVKSLIQSSCVSCHSAYGSYASVKASSSSIRSSIVNGSMPKGSTLTTDQKNIIICWIDAGSLNN